MYALATTKYTAKKELLVFSSSTLLLPLDVVAKEGGKSTKNANIYTIQCKQSRDSGIVVLDRSRGGGSNDDDSVERALYLPPQFIFHLPRVTFSVAVLLTPTQSGGRGWVGVP